MPRVTVIIPTYNLCPRAAVLDPQRRLADFSDFELLVIGDHCTDESESVVTAIGDRRVRWINLPKNVAASIRAEQRGASAGRGAN